MLSIVVPGFGVREASRDRLRSCLEGLARQGLAVEVVLVEGAGLSGEVSVEIRDILPDLRVAPCESEDPWARRTEGAKIATGRIIAFIDADCIPQPGWLQAVLDTFQYYPEIAAVRGSGGQNWLQRLLGKREAGTVRTTAANNVAFRREAYLDCPFPIGSGSKAVALQSATMRRARYVLWEEPAMKVIVDRRGLRQAAGVQVDYSTATR